MHMEEMIMKKRYINELIDSSRGAVLRSGEVLLPDADRVKAANRVNLLALGDVGGTVLMGLRLLGGEAVGQIGIYDLNEHGDEAPLRDGDEPECAFPTAGRCRRSRRWSRAAKVCTTATCSCSAPSKGVPPVATTASATAAGGRSHGRQDVGTARGRRPAGWPCLRSEAVKRRIGRYMSHRGVGSGGSRCAPWQLQVGAGAGAGCRATALAA